MAGISSLGIGTGLDLNGLLDQLEAAEREKLAPLVRQEKSYQSKISAYGHLESALDAFQQAAAKLNDADSFRAVTSSISGEGATAAAGADAVPGRYDISVTNLARAQSLASAGVPDKTSSLANATSTITITQGSGDPVEIAIEAGSSLEAIRDAINGTDDIGVSASIINNGTDYRLVLTSKETGTESAVTVTSDLSGLDLNGMDETVAAENASLTVNGIAISSQSNRLEEAIQGVTLDLTEVGDSTLSVSRDSESISGDIQAFVDAYNSLQKTMDQLTSFDAGSNTAGLLLGDSTMRGIESSLRSVMSGGVEGGEHRMLSSIGIELQLDGTLEVNSEKLDELVANDPQSLSDFFGGVEEGEGLADKLDNTLKTMLDDEGLIDIATTGLESSIESLGERYARMEVNINATIERYRGQFAQMDLMVSQMNSTMSYLTQQFDMMNAQLKQ